MFLGLRMNEGVTRAAFEQSFGVPIEAVYLETLRKLKEQGLFADDCWQDCTDRQGDGSGQLRDGEVFFIKYNYKIKIK